tara:strand:- start:24220 stop:25053 length:834 start_codon:yes stop_codon:yes gene_type:complete
MIIYNRTQYKKLTNEQYQEEKRLLQIELLKLQEWVINYNKSVAILFEGRDAAGKGATIRRFIERLMPKRVRVEELGVPSDNQSKNWLNTYKKLLPKTGELVFFDRSWYSRALIQPVMNYCSENQYKFFMKNVNKWEDELESEGIILIKFYLSVSQKSQTLRFKLRESSPLKYWKLSENDLEVAKEWDLFTYYKEQMFKQTSTNKNPWVIINSDNKMIARLNAMRYVLSHINYKNKKILKSNHWSEEIENYSIRFNNVLFDNLSKEQYELLFSMQSHK